MNIALLQNHTGHYYRIQHLINTLRVKNDVIEINSLEDVNYRTFDILILEYFSSHTSDPHKEMCERINSFKYQILNFKGKVIFYNVDDGQATHIRNLDIDIANRIDAWFVYMINEDYLNDNIKIKNLLKNKFVLIPRYTLPYTDSDDVVYEKKQNKIVFVGSTTGNYWFNGKNWRVECLNRIYENPYLNKNFDGWLVNDKIIDVSIQNYNYNNTMKYVKKGEFLSEEQWYTKLKNSTLSLCIPGNTRYGYRHPQSMVCKCTMLANFDLEKDPYPWMFSDKLKNISYTVKDDLSNFEEICEESLGNTEKTKMYAYAAYDVYKSYFESTRKNTYQEHVWSIVKDNLTQLNIYDI